jgi:hypothetical protein
MFVGGVGKKSKCRKQKSWGFLFSFLLVLEPIFSWVFRRWAGQRRWQGMMR